MEIFRAGAWLTGRVAPTETGAIVGTNTGKFTDVWLNQLPDNGRVVWTGLHDDGGTPGARTVDVKPQPTNVHEFSGGRVAMLRYSLTELCSFPMIFPISSWFRRKSLYSSDPLRPLWPLCEAFRVFGVFRGCAPLSPGYGRLFCRSTLNSRPSTLVAALPRCAAICKNPGFPTRFSGPA